MHLDMGMSHPPCSIDQFLLANMIVEMIHQVMVSQEASKKGCIVARKS